jgi:TolA-binding protein
VSIAFEDAVNEYGCRLTDESPEEWSIRTNNADRMCMRGQVGAMLQEEVVLETQLEQVFEKVQSLIRNIAREQAYILNTQENNESLANYINISNMAMLAINTILRSIQSSLQVTETAVQPGDCIVIVGLAGGTNCVGAAIAAGIKASAQAASGALSTVQQTLNETEKVLREALTQSHSDNEQIAQLRLQLDQMTPQVEAYIQEYQLLIQQIYNNRLKAEDTRYLAQRTAARYNDTVSSIVDRLIGRESGSVLLRNKLVQDANDRFGVVLDETYKMAQAFLYRYNYGDGAAAVVNKVYTLQTIDDVKGFMEELTRKERDYCGEMGLDCDYKNNQKILRLSLRDAVYPNLRDIYAKGKVLTAGQQFHNEITSDYWARKRRRASGVQKQIELPIRIWMAKGGGASGEDQYMVNAEECNHFIVGERNGGGATQGTIAVNVIGTRLPPNIEYELWRNATDYVRSCTEKTNDIENKVEVYQVGWAPQNSNSDLDNPDTFLTHSQAFTACQNNWKLEDPNSRNNEDACYNYFARDRSLGTLDMTFVLPSVDGSQNWVFGDGLPDEEKPIIEDIILYFRYNSQPIYSDGTK